LQKFIDFAHQQYEHTLTVLGGPAGIVRELETLYSRHQASAVDWAERRYGDRSFAEDAVQDAFLELFNSFSKGHRAPAFGGSSMVRRNTRWAAGKLLARARSGESRDHHYAVAGLVEDDAWVRQEWRALIAAICGGLPKHHWEALRLRYIEGHSDSSAARMLGLSVEAFRSRHRRALEEARRVSQTLPHDWPSGA
jgi:RNA polymerase sigma factor (sigma-70 family)